MSIKKTILITGGLGYIGSHTIVELYNENYLREKNINKNFEVVLIDDCSSCSDKIIPILERMIKNKIYFYKISLTDKNLLEEPFKKHQFYSVIHFAGKKSVNESIDKPLFYYENNFIGSFNLINLCLKYKVNNFIFSSSCTVYGNREDKPKEDEKYLFPINPYGKSKLFVENMLKDTAKVNKDFKVVILRYCNPVSCHPSGLIGEDPFLNPTNLFPVIQNLVRGTIKELVIFGNDYPTKDGTCIRDYIHVIDIAQGHIIVLNLFDKENEKLFIDNCVVYNMGTNKGYSVKEVVETYEKVNGIKLNYRYGNRRKGDAIIAIPDCNKIYKELGWNPKIKLEQMCKDSYNFIKKNPKGLFQN
jgi:UDP-glucose 4-epimerase